MAVRPKYRETMILGLVNQFYCVSEGLKVHELAAELKNVGDIWAVAVVDDKMEAKGVIVTTQFQKRMSLPFAHDVLGKEPITELMTATRSFPFDRNVFTVSEDLAEEVRKSSNQYYLVEDSKGKYCGIFSTKDLLIHRFNAHMHDIEMAVAIQQAVVPSEIVRTSRWLEICAFSKMAKGVGGDFLAIGEPRPGSWLLSLCDVSGKGIAASLVTAALGGMFAQYEPERGLVPFISQVNKFILDTFRMEKYLTGVFIEIDEARKSALLCDMGHSYVGILRDGSCLKEPSPNPFLGFLPALSVQSRSLELRSGDLLFAYTDGFVEQANVEGREFGVEAFERLLADNRDRPLSELANFLHGQLKDFRGDAPRSDDEAILLVRVS
jgi:sigma-B regulation protein RsbU (phosphoserine phosphatase)